MIVQKFEISDLMLINGSCFEDSRGFFTERFKKSEFQDIGIQSDFIQDNYSRSAFGVLRGLHYQYDQPQSKLVTCTRGCIFDVAVDIRQNSKTFGQARTTILDGAKPTWFWIPSGFAHGFVVLSAEGADLWYKVDAYYNSKGEGSIAWNDPDLNIQWPKEILHQITVSARDQQAMSFKTYKDDPKFY